MGKDFEISDKIINYINNLSKELHPVQKEIIAYNETLGEVKKMQIAISQCHFLELITRISKNFFSSYNTQKDIVTELCPSFYRNVKRIFHCSYQ